MIVETLTVGDLKFELRRSARRRSVQVTVDRGGELVLTAPDDCPSSTMEAFVREKRFWIYTHADVIRRRTASSVRQRSTLSSSAEVTR